MIGETLKSLDLSLQDVPPGVKVFVVHLLGKKEYLNFLGDKNYCMYLEEQNISSPLCGLVDHIIKTSQEIAEVSLGEED